MRYPSDKQLGTRKNSIGLTPAGVQIGGYSTNFDNSFKTFNEGDLIGIYLVSMAGHLMCYAKCNGTLFGQYEKFIHFWKVFLALLVFIKIPKRTNHQISQG
jgi:hypothetical protein